MSLPASLLYHDHRYVRAAVKHGAGLLFVTRRHVLLLKRSARSGNPRTWGLAGGRLQVGEAPAAGARREAQEEIGPLPRFTVQAHYLRDTPAHHFDIYVVRVSSEVRRAWRPRLNNEHTEWRWFPCHELPAKLHPVVAWLAQHNPCGE
jgi:8-oxo-dGTP diphosphatase